LTLISSPLKKIIQSSGFDPKIDKDVKLIQRNVTRLQNLINQLMDFRALENKKYKVKPKNGDLAVFIHELLSLFYPLIEEHQIRLTFECQNESLPACFDHDIYEKIFYNLLSNAVKFTPNEGQIIIHLGTIDVNRSGNNQDDLAVQQKTLEFQVTNTGSFIPDSHIQHLFDNYYHIEKHNSVIQQGSGVGLAFTKELIDLLNGEISVSSNDSETCFKIRIPLYSPVSPELCVDQADSAKNPTFPFSYSQEMVDLLAVERSKSELLNDNIKLPTLLIVEDNADLKEHLFDLFKADYKVFVGSDGVEGLKLARDKSPVIIISDVYMPKMTGTEMTRQLKSDILTSHIPIILLSAFNSQEQKNEGLETGADVYVEKPFDPDNLKLQVKSLLQSREAIRLAFSKKIMAEPGIERFVSTDELFIQKALVVVEKNMDDSEFNVESFVREMGLGRTVLYQKIKALTDLSVNDFIQNIRLKRAAQLLRDTDLSISEVAYKVGFNEPKYFSTCFKKHFNQTPSGYIADHKK
jgi:DNA-binding response OmpR family regulator